MDELNVQAARGALLTGRATTPPASRESSVKPAKPAMFSREISSRLKRFFTGRIFLRRKGFDWHFEIEKNTKAPSVQPVSPDLVEMRRELRDLLDRHTGTRLVLQHLATIERLLKCRQPPDFTRLPLALLEGAQRQLETLSGGKLQGGLAMLNARLRGALTHRGLVNDRPQDLRAVQVEEVSVSMFQEADQLWEASWTGQSSSR